MKCVEEIVGFSVCGFLVPPIEEGGREKCLHPWRGRYDRESGDVARVFWRREPCFRLVVGFYFKPRD
jgi:hypothetical protein